MADIEIVFDDRDARSDQQRLHLHDRGHEFLILVVAAEPHHMLDAGAIVPAAVEQDHFLENRQLCDIALEIPFRGLAIRWLGQRDDTGFARAQMLDDALDRPILAAGVPPLDDDQNPAVVLDDVALQFHQFDLQFDQQFGIVLVADPSNRRRGLDRWVQGVFGHGCSRVRSIVGRVWPKPPGCQRYRFRSKFVPKSIAMEG